MHEYRCTFPDKYPFGCIGHSNPSARQGYYVVAKNELAAAEHIAKTNPNERIDVQYWGPVTGSVSRIHARGKHLLLYTAIGQ